MSAFWNGDKELQLIKLLCEREVSRRGATGLTDMKGRLAIQPIDRCASRSELSLSLTLGPRVGVELVGAINVGEHDLGKLEEVISEMLEGVEAIEGDRNYLIEQLSALRRHLSRRLASERRRGAYIKGSIDIGRVAVNEVREAVPVVSINCIREDLRMHLSQFVAEKATDIDSWLEEMRDDVMFYSLQLDSLKALGAVGKVHPLLVFGLKENGFCTSDVLCSAYENKNHMCDFRSDNDDRIVVYWQRGIMTGTCPIAKGIQFQGDKILMSEETLKVSKSAKGKDLGKVLAIRGVEGASITVTDVRSNVGNSQTLYFDAKPIPFNEDGDLIL